MSLSSGAQLPEYPIVDIHTHIYPESYLELLRSRRTIPYLFDPPDGPPRAVILPSDDNPNIPQEKRGRPLEQVYWDINLKLEFMKQHNITTSIVSPANPWLDFVPADQAVYWAEKINDDLDKMCNQHQLEQGASLNSGYSLFAFGILPLTAPTPEDVAKEIRRIKTLKSMKGVVMGTIGLGKGLDDPAMDPVWAAIEETQLLLFLHPHYGIPIQAFGGPDNMSRYGHILPLAIGFTVETTIAATRMYLSGVYDRFPNIRVLLAHSGGTLPMLAGRIEMMIAHERWFIVDGKRTIGPKRAIWDVLNKNIYLDAVVYGDPGLRAAIAAGGSSGRVLFGTDHPFFPPITGKEGLWLSVTSNTDLIDGVLGHDSQDAKDVMGGNAARILDLA